MHPHCNDALQFLFKRVLSVIHAPTKGVNFVLLLSVHDRCWLATDVHRFCSHFNWTRSSRVSAPSDAKDVARKPNTV